jgi:hypothetical protein
MKDAGTVVPVAPLTAAAVSGIGVLIGISAWAPH